MYVKEEKNDEVKESKKEVKKNRSGTPNTRDADSPRRSDGKSDLVALKNIKDDARGRKASLEPPAA